MLEKRKTSPTFWVRKRLILILGLLVSLAGHLLVNTGAGLSVDEAHYALYALHPALSYFDHPPLVGWLQIPFVWLGDHGGLGDGALRIVPLSLWCFNTAAWLWLARQWRLSAAACLWLYWLCPIFQLLGVALVPDSVLVTLTPWAMYLTQRLSNAIDDKAAWLGLGLVLGLAGLAKFSGIFLALGVLLVLVPKHPHALFKTPWSWVAGAIALGLISPVLLWNAQHDWIALTYQAKHATGSQSFSWTQFLWQSVRFDLVTLLAYGALLPAGVFMGLWWHRRQVLLVPPTPQEKCTPPSSPQSLPWTLSLAFSLPLLMAAAYAAGRDSALPHWTAPAWMALLPLAARGITQCLRRFPPSPWPAWPTWCLGALALWQAGTILTTGTAMVQGDLPSLIRPSGPPARGDLSRNPFADLHGWAEAGELASELAKALQSQYAEGQDGRAGHTTPPTLVVHNWTLASRLAWYARPQAVWAMDGKNKQFDLWWPQAHSADRLLFVNWSRMPLGSDPFASPRGLRCQPLRTLETAHARFYFSLCTRESRALSAD